MLKHQQPASYKSLPGLLSIFPLNSKAKVVDIVQAQRAAECRGPAFPSKRGKPVFLETLAEDVAQPTHPLHEHSKIFPRLHLEFYDAQVRAFNGHPEEGTDAGSLCQPSSSLVSQTSSSQKPVQLCTRALSMHHSSLAEHCKPFCAHAHAPDLAAAILHESRSCTRQDFRIAERTCTVAFLGCRLIILRNMQVHVQKTFAIPVRIHGGARREGVCLHACPSFHGKSRFDDVAIRCFPQMILSERGSA